MGEMILQSCKADVRVKRKEGGKIEIKVLRYKSLVDCLSVDEGGNGSESKSKKFKMLNREGHEQQGWLSITTSDGKKHRFKVKEAIPADQFLYLVGPLNESQDLSDVVGVLKNVYTELIELPQILAEAPKKVPVAKYDSGKKTLTYSKNELGYQGMKYFADMVGHTIELGLFEEPIDLLFDYGVSDLESIYARIGTLSVKGDDVFVELTTDGIKTKGKYANEKVLQALNNVNSGEFYVGIYDLLYTDGAAYIQSAAGRYSEQRPNSEHLDVILVDDGVIGLDNGKSRVGFKAKEARILSFDAATETIGSMLSNKYIEEMIKTGEDTPTSGIKLHVKTTSGDIFVVAIEYLERNGDIWAGEISLPNNIFSSDTAMILSSGLPLLSFPGWF